MDMSHQERLLPLFHTLTLVKTPTDENVMIHLHIQQSAVGIQGLLGMEFYDYQSKNLRIYGTQLMKDVIKYLTYAVHKHEGMYFKDRKMLTLITPLLFL